MITNAKRILVVKLEVKRQLGTASLSLSLSLSLSHTHTHTQRNIKWTQLIRNNGKGCFPSVAKVLGIFIHQHLHRHHNLKFCHPWSVQPCFVQRSSHPDTGARARTHTHTHTHTKIPWKLNIHGITFSILCILATATVLLWLETSITMDK